MRPTLAACVLLLMIAGCGGDKADRANGAAGAAGQSTLPAPAGASGVGVTGMPGARELDEGEAADPMAAPDAIAGAPAEALDGELPTDPATTMLDEAPPSSDGSSSQDAVTVIREYYAALNAGAYGRAYTLWADGGRASGQSPQQFADMLAQTEGHSVEISAPMRIEASADARQAEVPVSLLMRQPDGTQRRFVGRYVLRLSDAEGAWRIVTADLREAAP